VSSRPRRDRRSPDGGEDRADRGRRPMTVNIAPRRASRMASSRSGSKPLSANTSTTRRVTIACASSPHVLTETSRQLARIIARCVSKSATSSRGTVPSCRDPGSRRSISSRRGVHAGERGGVEQLLLRREVAVDRGDRHPRTPADLRNRDRGRVSPPARSSNTASMIRVFRQLHLLRSQSVTHEMNHLMTR
jgi:hypothetical protein